MDKKESMEAAKALGYLLGNLHEVFKDGLGVEDMKSFLDLAKEHEMLMEGFKGFDKMIEEFKSYKHEDLMMFIAELSVHYKKGKE